MSVQQNRALTPRDVCFPRINGSSMRVFLTLRSHFSMNFFSTTPIYFTDMRNREESIVPSLFRVGGYLIFFWSNENGEPIHVHIAQGKPGVNATKVWLTRSGQCIVANNNSKIPQSDLNELLDVISAQFFMICRKWKEHFCVDSVQFFC